MEVITSSMEEEQISKLICECVAKSHPSDDYLCQGLARYLEFLHRDIPNFMINFSKAAFIVLNSTKVFGAKVDCLCECTFTLCDALKYGKESQQRRDAEKKDGEEDNLQDEQLNPEKVARRRKKTRGISSDEDFIEIDNACNLKKHVINETETEVQYKLPCREKSSNLFLKSKRERKRVDVTLVPVEDKDESRIRDWFLDGNLMISRELFSDCSMTEEIRNKINFEALNDSYSDEVLEEQQQSVHTFEEELIVFGALDEPDEANNNDVVEAAKTLEKEGSPVGSAVVERRVGRAREPVNRVNLLNVDDAKFAELIPAKKLKPGRPFRPPCKLCEKKGHKRKTRNCPRAEDENLDSYFVQFMTLIVADPTFGIVTDSELVDLYKEEIKKSQALARLQKRANADDLIYKFKEFPGFENDDLDLSDDLLRVHDDNDLDQNELDLGPVEDLPQPRVVEPALPSLFPPGDDAKSDGSLVNRHTRLVMEEMKDSAIIQQCFERNKQLRVRIAAWHESLADKIAESQRRGALIMNELAENIMNRFPPFSDGEQHPKMTFEELVRGEDRKSVPRFFLGCLQLTNENNINIEKESEQFLAKDCVVLTKLRAVRIREELENYSSPSKNKETERLGRKRRKGELIDTNHKRMKKVDL